MIRCGDLAPFGHFWRALGAFCIEMYILLGTFCAKFFYTSGDFFLEPIYCWGIFHSDHQGTLISFITLTTGGAEVHAGDLRRRGEGLGHVHPRPERVQPLDSADLFGFQEPSRSPGVAPEVHPGDEVG